MPSRTAAILLSAASLWLCASQAGAQPWGGGGGGRGWRGGPGPGGFAGQGWGGGRGAARGAWGGRGGWGGLAGVPTGRAQGGYGGGRPDGGGGGYGGYGGYDRGPAFSGGAAYGRRRDFGGSGPGFAGFAPPGAGAGYASRNFDGGWRQQQDEVRRAVREGRHIPLSRAIEAVRRRAPGRELDAAIEPGPDGRSVYRLRWAGQDGRRQDFLVDAGSGAVVGVEGGP